MQDTVVAATCRQIGVVPGDGADAAFVATEGPNQSVLYGIPDLKLASVSSYCKKGTITAPLNASHTILWPDVAELRHLAIRG